MIPIYLDDKKVYKDFKYPIINAERTLDNNYENAWITIREPRFLDSEGRLFICFCWGQLDSYLAALFYKDEKDKIHLFAVEDWCYIEGLKVLYTIASIRENKNIEFFQHQLTAQLMHLGHEISKTLPFRPSYTNDKVLMYIEEAIAGWKKITFLDEVWIRRLFYEFYYGLVAEDNRFLDRAKTKITKVGHSIKFRGIQNVFYSNMDPQKGCTIICTEHSDNISYKIKNWAISYMDESRTSRVIQGNWLEPQNILNYIQLVQKFDRFGDENLNPLWAAIKPSDRANSLLT